MNKTPATTEPSHWILTHCPLVGDEVVGRRAPNPLSLEGGKAIWWYCPACTGWHIITVVEEAGPTPKKKSGRSTGRPRCKGGTH